VTAEEHNKTLATLHFVYGGIHGLTLVGLLLMIVVVWGAAPETIRISTMLITVGVAVFLVLLFAVGLLPVVVGYGLAKRKRWAKSLGMFVGVISLINIPIGTALGIYLFRFLRSEGGIRLYGGKPSATSEQELQAAMRGAQPLMNWADRLK
jgi:hypothetical protein